MVDLVVERAGDVLACHFAGEEDLALFIPGSGDVLLSSVAQWRGLKAGGKSISTHSLAGAPNAASQGREGAADELKTALLSLGVALE